MAASSRPSTVADRLYRLSLLAYPRSFRRAYGPALVQIFHDCARDAQRERGLPGLLGWWGRTASDLVVTAGVQRTMEMRGRLAQRGRGVTVTLIALLLSVATGYLNTHTDEVLVVLPWVLLASGVFGLTVPHGVWRGALFIGLAVPVSQIVAPVHVRVPYPNALGDIGAACIALVPALIGATSGAMLRWSVRHSMVRPTSRLGAGRTTRR